MNRKELTQKHWNYYLLLEKHFLETIEYVELDSTNFNVFPNAYALLIQSIGAELDAVFKVFCGFNPTERKTISDYASCILHSTPDIINYKHIGDNTQTIEPEMSMTFNLFQDILENQTFEFTSLDESVATVEDNGKVTATGIGTTFVRVRNVENNRYTAVKVNVDGLVGQTQPKLVGGFNHFVALKSDGTVWTWGGNECGELGLGDTTARKAATKTNMKNVIDIAAGNEFTLILRKRSSIYR